MFATAAVVVVEDDEIVVLTRAAVIVNAAGQVIISVPVVTVTLRAPNVAPAAMVILATASVGALTFVLLTVIPRTAESAQRITLVEKLVFAPVIVTLRVAP